MGDGENTSNPNVGQRTDTSQQGSSGSEVDNTTPVTMQDLITLKSDMEKLVTQTAQSYADKGVHRLRTEVQGQLAEVDRVIAMLKDNGHEVDPAIIASIKDKAGFAAAFLSKEPNSEPEADNATDQQQTQAGKQKDQAPATSTNIYMSLSPDEVNALAAGKLAKSGFDLSEADPEFSKIKIEAENPKDFLDSLDDAIRDKKARIAASNQSNAAEGQNKQQQQPGMQPGTDRSKYRAAALSGAGGPAGPAIPQGTDPLDLLSKAYKKSD